MKYAKALTSLVFILGLLVSALPAHAETTTPESTALTSPTALVKNFYDQLTDTMKQGETLGFSGRYKKLDPVVRSTFNLPLMARFAANSGWAEAKPDEQQKLVEAFSDFSIANYASRFSKYDGERFEVVGEKPASGGGTIVETRLTPKDGEPVVLNYLVRADDKGQPRIADVFLDAAISQLATRRSEFSAIIKHDGFPALITSIIEKNKKMGVL